MSLILGPPGRPPGPPGPPGPPAPGPAGRACPPPAGAWPAGAAPGGPPGPRPIPPIMLPISDIGGNLRNTESGFTTIVSGCFFSRSVILISPVAAFTSFTVPPTVLNAPVTTFAGVNFKPSGLLSPKA